MVESALAESDFQVMSSTTLQDLPDLKALTYFHLILFCPGNDFQAELDFIEEVKRYHPGHRIPLILIDPKGVFEHYECFDDLDIQDYRGQEINKRALRFAAIHQIAVRKAYLEQGDEIKRLQLERNQKNNLLEEVSLKAQESDRLKTAFLNNISHELRTPMNGILGFLEYLEDPQLEGELKERFIKNIRVSSERLLSTLQDLIEISEIEAGDLKVKFENVNLRYLLDFIYRLFLPRAQAKNLDLSCIFDLPEDRVMIWSDANKIKGILIHLLNNALKFTNSGRIEMGLSMEEDRLSLTVSDTGIGMNEEDIQLIYKHFVQIEEHLTRKYDGLGLGLTICEAYSRCLNGDLKIESAVDQGTKVKLCIPFINGKEETVKVRPAQGKTVRFKAAKVLLVDDDPINLQLLERFLRDSTDELETIKAKNGVEAVEFFRQEGHFDLILMDLKMPLMNGLEATKLIREMDDQIPIIAQTAYAMHQDKEKALDEGCNDYLSKPLNKDLFYETVEKYLNHLKLA